MKGKINWKNARADNGLKTIMLCQKKSSQPVGEIVKDEIAPPHNFSDGPSLKMEFKWLRGQLFLRRLSVQRQTTKQVVW